jgi:formylglycine-generating enzyme required for sulfatase activity
MKNFCWIALILFGCSEKSKLVVENKVITLDEQLIISSCPLEMKLIEGKYCSQVLQVCKSYMEPPKSTPFARCLEFNKTKCIGKETEMSFCIDTEEYTNNSDKIPLSNISWIEAKSFCEKENKRLCSESEWNFACEGEEIYPYTTGYIRPSKQCNMDISKNIICNNKLCDYKNSIELNPECISPFNVHNMAGNVDEWIEVPQYQHSKIPDLFMRTSLKGGHWLPVRNRCRPRTDDHDENFHQISVGFRCCKDILP